MLVPLQVPMPPLVLIPMSVPTNDYILKNKNNKRSIGGKNVFLSGVIEIGPIFSASENGVFSQNFSPSKLNKAHL